MAFKEVTNSNNGSIQTYWPAKAAERKEGDSVVGKYIKKMDRQNPDGTHAVLYVLQGADGSNVGVNSSATIANAMEQIPEGSTVKIVYKGKQKSNKTGRTYNDFRVYVDEDDTATKEDESVDLTDMSF